METGDGQIESIPTELLVKIPALKREYGDLFLYQLGNEVVAYRPLTLAEFIDFQEIKQHDQMGAEDQILRSAIVHPDNAIDIIDMAGAGAVDLLVQSILGCSNLDTFEDLQLGLQAARMQAQSAESAMIAWICAAFPGIKPKDVYAMSQLQMLRHVALAELILQRPLQFEDPNIKKKKKDGRKKGFGMLTPPTQAPTGSSQAPGIPGEPPRASQITAFDFSEENKLMGYSKPQR